MYYRWDLGIANHKNTRNKNTKIFLKMTRMYGWKKLRNKTSFRMEEYLEFYTFHKLAMIRMWLSTVKPTLSRNISIELNVLVISTWWILSLNYKHYLLRIDYFLAKCKGQCIIMQLRIQRKSFNLRFSIFAYFTRMCLNAHNFLVERRTKMF